MAARWILVSALLLLTATSSLADSCDETAAKIMASTGAKFERAASVNRMMSHPDAQSMSVSCPRMPDEPLNYANTYDVFVSWNGPFPDASFFDLSGRAGAVLTGDTPAQVATAVRACHQKALKLITPTQTDGSVDELVRGRTAVECQVFKRDGGGAAFTIYKHFKH